MTTPSPWKWLTVVSAIALGAGFIAYRTGLLKISALQAAAPGSATQQRVLISSSKSAAIVTPSSQPAPSTKPTQRPVMSGSKSFVVPDSPSR